VVKRGIASTDEITGWWTDPDRIVASVNEPLIKVRGWEN
jgi:hypothetical protein